MKGAIKIQATNRNNLAITFSLRNTTHKGQRCNHSSIAQKRCTPEICSLSLPIPLSILHSLWLPRVLSYICFLRSRMTSIIIIIRAAFTQRIICRLSIKFQRSYFQGRRYTLHTPLGMQKWRSKKRYQEASTYFSSLFLFVYLDLLIEFLYGI